MAAVRSAVGVICSRTTFGPNDHALPVPADASTDCGNDGRLLAQLLDRPAKPPERVGSPPSSICGYTTVQGLAASRHPTGRPRYRRDGLAFPGGRAPGCRRPVRRRRSRGRSRAGMGACSPGRTARGRAAGTWMRACGHAARAGYCPTLATAAPRSSAAGSRLDQRQHGRRVAHHRDVRTVDLDRR